MPKSLFSIVLFGFTTFIFAQKSQQENLELRKAKIQKEIIANEKKLLTVKKKEKTAVEVMDLQTQKIKLKETLIQTTEKQTHLLSNDMQISELKIDRLDNELSLLKTDYAEMILKSYKSRSEESRAMFVLSSSSFLQAYKRLQYMKQYANFRKVQGQEIQLKSKELMGYYEQLKSQKIQKERLIAENEKEKKSLEEAKNEQQKIVSLLQKDKKKIAADIKKKQQEARNIDREIDRLIRKAIAEANRKAALARAAKEKALKEKVAKEKALADKLAKEKALAEKIKNGNTKDTKTKEIVVPVKDSPSKVVAIAPVSSTKMELTSESKLVSDNFKANKGRLPWPVDRGDVFIGFGTQPHPVYKTLTIQNSGLSISTYNGAHARAVFAGEVFSVIAISNNKAVMIQHGDYFTVYQNLSTINVSKGDKVSTKQSLGTIRTNSDGKTILKFTLCQNVVYVNPRPWLSPK
ncbi:peptidoglycan DD-metalloendopeptidase family protein [Flavobacterium sp.]|jgi:septal ring factor EnvC (AmiA/AmiB activator)|uniref:murein hydrolase activator EnvC family protein n=1 Tax=Flavobacterium sp. TaxID=239 RepID=UPI0022C17478|nr:peptidoglycan DD-metalloendopeptidase family protein [Flavobacterium sp.]MCZ8229990.1 peptidoglycan DD-metalloendopeptidase family protein [Flavobacterium sp.]